MNGLLNINTMPVTAGLLANTNPINVNNSITNAGMSQDPLASGFFSAIKNNPTAGLALGAALLQAGGSGMSTGAGIGYGLSAFSQALALAEQQKQQNRIAALKTMELENKIRNQAGGFFQGTGMTSQLANLQAQRYMQQGLPQQEAIYRAGRDVMQSAPQYTRDPATGALIQTPPAQLPYVGAEMPVTQSSLPVQPPSMVQPELTQPSAQPFAPSGTSAADIFPTYGGQQPSGGFMDTLTNQGLSPLPQPAAPAQVPATMTPIEQATQSEAMIKSGVKKYDEISKLAATAPDALNNANQALAILDSGFEGGKLAGLRAEYQRLKGSSNPTPEEQKFLQDYATLERYAGNATFDYLNKFTGAISDGERAFAGSLAASPLEPSQSIRTKIMLDYVASQAALRKQQLADEWTASYGNLNKKSPDGLSFDKYLADFASQNPIITPELSQKFGALYYITDDTDIDSLPSGLRIFDVKNKKTGVVE